LSKVLRIKVLFIFLAGLASAWIYRRHAQKGFGATHPPEAIPKYNFQFKSMEEMAKAHWETLDESDGSRCPCNQS